MTGGTPTGSDWIWKLQTLFGASVTKCILHATKEQNPSWKMTDPMTANLVWYIYESCPPLAWVAEIGRFSMEAESDVSDLALKLKGYRNLFITTSMLGLTLEDGTIQTRPNSYLTSLHITDMNLKDHPYSGQWLGRKPLGAQKLEQRLQKRLLQPT